jgi:hypothetical protein
MQVNLDDEFAVSPSAHRHGTTDDQIRHALRQRMWVFERDEQFVMVVGPADGTGRLIEVGMVVPTDGGPPIAVHAMPARAGFIRGRR